MENPEKISFQVTADKFPIIHLPWRKFPGIGISEDDLRSLLTVLSVLHDHVKCTPETRASVSELQERVHTALEAIASPAAEHLRRKNAISPDAGFAVRPVPLAALPQAPYVYYVFQLDTLASMTEQLNLIPDDARWESEQAHRMISKWYNALRHA